MSDRELLEMAAKVAGYRIHHWSTILPGPMLVDPSTDDCGGYWNPLESDGDALRLAVKLGIDIINSSPTLAQAVKFSKKTTAGGYADEPRDPDTYAATRRAIVRAAAAIARSQ